MTDLTGRAAGNKTCKAHHRVSHYRYAVLDLTGLSVKNLAGLTILRNKFR
jgi:hypothetical protein